MKINSESTYEPLLENQCSHITIRCSKTSDRGYDMEHFISNTNSVDVLRQVKSSIKAEQVFCSIVTQMKFMKQFKDQSALKTVHKENYETSYHRNTAAGNLRRIRAGESDELLILMTVECLMETEEHDKSAENALRNIEASDEQGQQWLASAISWHELRTRHLQKAKHLLREKIGTVLWNKGAALAE